MMRKKIALVGAGNIGGELAFSAANLELGDRFKVHSNREYSESL